MIFQKVLSGICGGKVLDVGCGSGQFIGVLMGSLGSFESVTGIDVDASVLQAHILENGISRPTQVIILGKKTINQQIP
jgi:2-polyprenyl-3-methyl-5-hydroxy-6-metoxy-1,4-benzoquinol methylase